MVSYVHVDPYCNPKDYVKKTAQNAVGHLAISILTWLLDCFGDNGQFKSLRLGFLMFRQPVRR